MLHYVFLPRINDALQIFQHTYSHHRLYVQQEIIVRFSCGSLELWKDVTMNMPYRGSGRYSKLIVACLYVCIYIICNLQDCYGIDWEGPAIDDDFDLVTVPTTRIPLNSHDMDTLTTTADPLLDNSVDAGLSLFSSVRSFVYACAS